MGARFDKWPHVICSQQFSREWLEGQLFPEALRMKEVVESGGCDVLKGKRFISFFYQPSTRTAASFACAIDYLGGKVVFSTENAREFSSASKGESLVDTLKVLEIYGPDAIIMRYDMSITADIPDTSAFRVPIINAGDRWGEHEWSSQHPTQGFLDAFTIQEKRGQIDGLSIAMVGDLLSGRTVRSLSYLLGRHKGIKIYYVSPQNLQMRGDVKAYLKRHDIWFCEATDLREVASRADVVYMTRTQTECGSKMDHAHGHFILDGQVLSLMKKDAIIMHPFPRGPELPPCIDSDPRAVYLTDQIEAGLLTRMALLKIIFS